MTTTRFSAAFANPTGSPIRELFPYLSQLGMISFAGGYPSTSLFDAEGLSEACRRALLDSAASLQYGATEGSLPFRQTLVQLLALRGVQCSPADVLVSTGSQQAFDLLIRILIEPGDCAFVETPAYPAAIQSLRLAGARITGVPVDADGIDVEALADLLSDPGVVKPKFIYTVPTFSNPSGSLLSLLRRRRLLELAREHGFLVIEDDPYGELRFEEIDVRTLYAMGQEAFGADSPVVYLSSLSKTVSPGLRIGWMVAGADVIRRCAVAKQTVDLCTSPFNQAVANEYLKMGRYEATVMRAAQEYRSRMTALAGAIEEKLAGKLRVVQPKGGMFMWAKIVADVDTKRLFEACVDEGVLYVPGVAFYPQNPDEKTMRLSFAAPVVPVIVEGVARLARAFSGAAR